MTKTIAKFKCDSVTIYDAQHKGTVSTEYDTHCVPDDAAYIQVVFSAVTAECPENKSWSKWTPSGELRMSITNPDCYNSFDPGSEYFLTIEKV